MNYFIKVTKIISIDLSKESQMVYSYIEFLQNNFDFKSLKILKIKLLGFPYRESNLLYFENLKRFLDRNKFIFSLCKISLKCEINELNFFSQFKTESFYLLTTNFFNNLFSCFSCIENNNILSVSFSKLEFSYFLNELFFYIFALSQKKDFLKYLKFIEIKYLYSKYTIFKHLNLENYKKFIKEFLEIKRFSQYKYQNDEHFLKIFSKANYNNIHISGEIARKNSGNISNNNINPQNKHFGNKLDFLIKDTKDIKETELENESSINDLDSNSSENFKNYDFNSECEYISSFNKRGRNDFRNEKNLNKENEEFMEYLDKSSSLDDFDEKILFDDNYERKIKSSTWKDKNSEKNYLDANTVNEMDITYQKIDFEVKNELDKIILLQNNKQDFEDENAIDNLYDEYYKNEDKNKESLLKAKFSKQENITSINNNDFMEIKNYSKLFEGIYFKIKSSLRNNKAVIILNKPLKNQISLFNLLNIEMRIESKNFVSKKFLGNFPPYMKVIKFDFDNYNDTLVKDILDNIIINGLKKVEKLMFNFDYFNLFNLKYINDELSKSIDFICKYDDNSCLAYKRKNSINIVNLNSQLIKIIEKNINLKKLKFISNLYSINNEHNSQTRALNSKNNFFKFSKVKFGNFIEIDLIFISKLFLNFIINIIKQQKDNYKIKLYLILISNCSITKYTINGKVKIFDDENEKVNSNQNNNDNNINPNKQDSNDSIELVRENSFTEENTECITHDINYLNYIQFLEYFKENENEDDGLDKSFFLKKLNNLKLNNFSKSLLKQKHCFFSKLSGLTNLSIIFLSEEIENDFIPFENRIIQENDMLNQDEYVKLDKLNIDDFNLLIDLFRDCKSKDNYQEKNDLIELNLFNVKNLKNLKNLKIKILNKEDEGFICAFIHFISKLGLSSLNKVILEGNIQDVYLEGCLKQIIENKDLYKMLNYLMIKCKMLSGFNEIYENYHYQTYTLIKNLILFEFINNYI